MIYNILGGVDNKKNNKNSIGFVCLDFLIIVF